MKAIVFGGSGFLGSHIADALSERGHEVRIFDCCPSPYRKDNQEMIVGDILDEDAVHNAIAGCDVVYNLAAIADIDECRKRPLDTAKINVLGNNIVLEMARLEKVRRYVFASSVYIYSDSGAFYRTSKRACELFIHDYYDQFGLEYTILRYGSLYGRRADERNSVCRILKEALTTGRIVYCGTGEEEREFIHVEDAAQASVDILSPDFANQQVTLTGPRVMKYHEFLEMVSEILGNMVVIEYRERRSNTHYKITPHTFSPKLGKKYVANLHIDIGQGLLDCLSEIYDKLYDEGDSFHPSQEIEFVEEHQASFHIRKLG